MKIAEKRIALPVASLCLALAVLSSAADAPKAKRVNRAIELLADGQPIYYTGSHSGTTGTFEQGVKDAQTFADYISYDMEHAPFDVKGLSEYMKGLVKGGPTKSGHRTPAVIVNVPVNGLDEATVRANAWMFNQVLATGVHGVLLTHADDPGAVRAFVEAIRFPIHKQGVGENGLKEGRRGVHGNPTAAEIWGVSQDEYVRKADPWPLNPEGELLLGLKLEDKYALANADANLKIPGIAFAEWGPGDMAMSLGVVGSGGSAVNDPRMKDARATVLAACKANHKFFLNTMTPTDVIDMIKEGVMIGPASPQAAEIGRKYTKRQLPW
ncbi:MAG TPA: aldolase/citrate lyase family protein [Bryobacteraceae bacterium]|nr:aldolase/citrate lyase family protein [Bryobacteraceae bacterium]